MRLDMKALALTLGILWGAAVLLVGVLHQFMPQYGADFLWWAASLYPGVSGEGWGSAILGGVFACVDGAVCGALIAWLYNRFAGAARPA